MTSDDSVALKTRLLKTEYKKEEGRRRDHPETTGRRQEVCLFLLASDWTAGRQKDPDWIEKLQKRVMKKRRTGTRNASKTSELLSNINIKR